MGLLRRRKSTSPPRVEEVPPRVVVEPTVIDDLRSAATAAAAAADRATTLAELAQRQALLATETARSATVDAPVAAEHVALLGAEVEKLAALVRSSIAESREARELVASLDQRITRLGVELSHQIDELSGDVDALAARPPDEAVPDDAVVELRSGQVRLAQEQARYQIAFRDDLARLADEMRRRSPG